ncbi:MAG: hypothetical protein ACJ714_15215 [Ornithinibacter sp.]
MQTPTTTDSRGVLCSEPSVRRVAASAAPRVQPIFPPKDADAEARRRWLATSPWPEVVFAAAV